MFGEETRLGLSVSASVPSSPERENNGVANFRRQFEDIIRATLSFLVLWDSG